MSTERWARLLELFEGALSREGEEREQFLRHQASPDEQAELQRLIAADRAPEPWLDRTAVELAARHAIGVGLGTGARLGSWEVVQELGHGGMGVVYLGRRADGLYNQQVAIKSLAPLAGGPELELRFEQERRILADLEHPAIARLLDAGQAADGSPFLVMERVEGLPIDEYCEQAGLDLAARLRLFVVVARAIAFAHRRLIVHCDLKPGHVLVTADGLPKLLDFGIARWLTGTGGGEARWFTPAYASPEQKRGETLTTASDVYSLGALLSRLVAEVPAGRRVYRADLDHILGRCLREDPAHRYGSADELGDDLERLLTLRPVASRASQKFYRIGLWSRRHRVALAVAAVVVTVAGALVLGLLKERRAAAQERRSAEQVAEFLAGLVRGANPAEEESPGTYLGEEARAARELVLDEASRRAASALEDQPLVRARLLAELGNAYRHLGALGKATPLLEEARALRAGAVGTRGEATLAESTLDLCRLELAKGEHASAQKLCEQAISELPVKLRSGSELLAKIENELGLVARAQGDPVAAQRLVTSGLELRRKLLPPDHPDLDLSLNNLALLLLESGEPDAAEALFAEVLRNRRARLGSEHLLVIQTLNNLASALQDLGRDREAEALYREALKVTARALGEAHPLEASIANNLGSLLQGRGEAAAAQAQFAAAVAIGRKALREDHPLVAKYRQNLGVALVWLKRYGEARSELAAALAVRRVKLGETHRDTLESLLSLAQAELGLGEAVEAEARLLEAERLWQQAPADPMQRQRARKLLEQCRQARVQVPPPGGGMLTPRTETPLPPSRPSQSGILRVRIASTSPESGSR